MRRKHNCRYQTALNRIVNLYAIDDDNTETLVFKAVKIAEKALLHPLCDAPKCYKQGAKFHGETDTYYCEKHLAAEARKIDEHMERESAVFKSEDGEDNDY